MSNEIITSKDNGDCVLVSKQYLNNINSSTYRKGEKINYDNSVQINAYHALDSFCDKTDYILINEQDLQSILKKCNESSSKSDSDMEKSSFDYAIDSFYEVATKYLDEIYFYRSKVSELINNFVKGDALDKKIEVLISLYEYEKDKIDNIEYRNAYLQSDSSSNQLEYLMDSLYSALNKIGALERENNELKTSLLSYKTSEC